MNILFIGPLPPPVTGHSLACDGLLRHLNASNDVNLVNLSKQNLDSGRFSGGRFLGVLNKLLDVIRFARRADVVYLTISESILGNVKDVLVYVILFIFGRLSKTILHLHGGSIKRDVFDRSKILFFVNKIFLRRVGAIIILGDSHIHLFDGIACKDKLYVVNNYAQESVFLSNDDVRNKYLRSDLIRVLYLSNFVDGKGYDDIVAAYNDLPVEIKRRIVINFAGAFESSAVKDSFLDSIKGNPALRYLGTVSGDDKVQLLKGAHIFCLPTALKEGQPISILEAYASGCVVVTTNVGGIPDIFVDGCNGFYVAPKRVETIRMTIERIVSDWDSLVGIGLNNVELARLKFNKELYLTSLDSIFCKVSMSGGFHGKL